MAYLQMEMHSKALVMTTTVSVILPDEIKPNEKLKTLYLLHGYRGNHMDWMRYTSIERYVRDERVAIIMPEVNNGYYTDTANGLNYFTYVADELPKRCETIFPLSKKREDRYIAGLSMGGYGAFKIAGLRPKRFAKAISLSGSLDIKHVYEMTKETDRKGYFHSVFGKTEHRMDQQDLYAIYLKLLKEDQKPELFMACGTEDFLFEDNERFYQYLVELGYSVYYETSAGAHEWVFWDHYIEKALRWILNPNGDLTE